MELYGNIKHQDPTADQSRTWRISWKTQMAWMWCWTAWVSRLGMWRYVDGKLFTGTHWNALKYVFEADGFMNCLIHACCSLLNTIEDLKKWMFWYNSKPDRPDQSLVSTTWGHDDYIGRSLALLKPGGRLMEIGKRGACDPGIPGIPGSGWAFPTHDGSMVLVYMLT